MTSKAFQFLRFPSLVLAGTLQVMPIVRVALPAAETAANVLAIVFRWVAGATAALGGVHAVSGASTLITSPLSANITQGQPYTLRLTTAPDQAHYWTASGLPAGLSLSGTSGQTLWQIVGTPTVTGTYNVGLTAKDQAGSGASRTVTATLVINIAAGVVRPAITSPPLSQSVVQGQSANFSVTASGTAPLSYQWRFKSANLAGQTGSTLVINPAATNNAGNYDVIVSNSGGSVTSAVATLTVIVPPRITLPPSSQTATQGLSASFSVAASGTAPLAYQWRFKSANLSGQTGPSLVINPVTTNNAGAYDAIVSNAAGSVTSAVATLTVVLPVYPPAITTPPVSQSVTQGQSASFSVAASGTPPLSYQWRFKSANLAGQTGANLVINPATTNQAGGYDVVVSNSVAMATSVVATLTVIVPGSLLQIVSQPVSQTVTQGQSATFVVGASGTAPLGYQWRHRGANLMGQTAATLVINPATTNNAGNYDAIVSNNSGSVTSAPASLTVLVPPAIITPPGSQTVTEGQSATFAVVAGGTGPLAYYWGKGGTVVAGPSGSSFTIANAQFADAGSYSVIVSNTAGTAQSPAATLTVQPAPELPSITVEPEDQSVLSGNSASFAVSASGTPPLYYQWFFQGGPLPGQTSPTLTLAGVESADAGAYSVLVTNAFGAATSRSAALSLVTTAGTYNGLYYDPADVSVFCAGSFTVTVTDKGSYSGALRLLASKYAFSGRFDSSGRSTNVIRREFPAPLTVELGLDLAGSDQIHGTVTDGSQTAELLGNRVVWNTQSQPAPQAGNYTLALPGAPVDTQSPVGTGFGFVRVDTAGRVRFGGVLADGCPVTQGAMISRFGEWPCYRALYGGQGALLGWLAFTNRPSDDINGLLIWTKLQHPLNKLYPLGFVVESEAVGSTYERPSPGLGALNLTSGSLQLIGGNLPQPLDHNVVMSADNQIADPGDRRLKIAIRAASGKFTGTLVNPQNGSQIALRGAVLQKQNTGCGFFINGNRSGEVYFGP